MYQLRYYKSVILESYKGNYQLFGIRLLITVTSYYLSHIIRSYLSASLNYIIAFDVFYSAFVTVKYIAVLSWWIDLSGLFSDNERDSSPLDDDRVKQCSKAQVNWYK
uniref:EXS domain-containing protein n=1 Tax=Syphacia muris TaxID=451379 RepID=A0A0N5AG09_9BILA